VFVFIIFIYCNSALTSYVFHKNMNRINSPLPFYWHINTDYIHMKGNTLQETQGDFFNYHKFQTLKVKKRRHRFAANDSGPLGRYMFLT